MNALSPAVPYRVGLRAADYLMLSDAGAFDHLGRTELIEGEIWAMNAVHSWHARVLMEVGRQIANALAATDSMLCVYSAGSVLLDDDSVPEPDISVAEKHDDGVLPFAKLKLAIEISDATTAIDLGRKMRLYARAGLAEYWVVERDARTVHQMWDPSGKNYRERRSVKFGEPLTAATLSEVTIATDRLG